MLITHTFIACLHCGVKLEVFDEDRKSGQIDCPECGYSNEMTDVRLWLWEEDF